MEQLLTLPVCRSDLCPILGPLEGLHTRPPGLQAVEYLHHQDHQTQRLRDRATVGGNPHTDLFLMSLKKSMSSIVKKVYEMLLGGWF
jgi:hypothetical protein